MPSISNTITVGSTKFHFTPGTGPSVLHSGSISWLPSENQGEVEVLLKDFSGSLSIKTWDPPPQASSKSAAGGKVSMVDLSSPTPSKSKLTPLKAKTGNKTFHSPMDDATTPGSLVSSVSGPRTFTPSKSKAGKKLDKSVEVIELLDDSSDDGTEAEEGIDFAFQETQQDEFDLNWDPDNLEIPQVIGEDDNEDYSFISLSIYINIYIYIYIYI
jgi:hypothetical protein